MVFAAGFEVIHAGIVLAMVRPFTEAVEIVLDVIPAMIIAVSLGMGISVIVIHSTKESCRRDGPE
jgi:LytS/YehU family sensor histidine kinase